MKFHIYKNELDEMKKIAEERDQPIGWPFEAIDEASMAQVGRPYAQTLDCNVHVIEYWWQKQGKHIVFIEDQATIDRLMSLKFKPSMVINAPLPYEAFSIAVPKGASYNGVPLFPALVSSYEEKSLQSLTKDFLKYIGYSKLHLIDFETQREITNMVNVSLCIPEELGTWQTAKNITNLSNSQITKLLALEPDDIAGMHEVFLQYKDSLKMTDYELTRQMMTVRLTIAMCIYNQATEGKFLRDGVPYGYSNKPKMFGITKQDFPTYKHSSMKLDPLNKGAAKGEHICTEHMRQLTHDKYYQGDFSEMPRGSRWTRVTEHLRGGGKAHTQTTE